MKKTYPTLTIPCTRDSHGNPHFGSTATEARAKAAEADMGYAEK